MPRRLALILGLLSLALPLHTLPAHAQKDDTALSETEVEQLRDSSYVANDRVLVFIKFLDLRTKELLDLYAHPRKPGREQDTHDLLEQFTTIADELNDNLDDYGPHHRDIRKALPKLLDATDRWSSAIKSPPDDAGYNVARRLSLEAIRDIREEANQLVEDQKKWFLAHPPAKEDKSAPTETPR
jgi:hypothetical protein